ncbi:MAG: BON domain-containing protein [Pyrinomonadaceae bacterium]
MKSLRNYLALFTAIVAFSFVGVNAQSYSVNNSAQIEQKVFKQLIKLPYYGVFDHLAYKVDGNTVFLYGKVRNAVNRKEAEGRIKKIAGVGNVVNEIKVLPLSSFDDSIRYRTLRTIANGGSLYRYFQGANPSVKIIVDRGNVTLEGFVASRGDANLANILANQVAGVFSVTNNLQIERDIRKN